MKILCDPCQTAVASMDQVEVVTIDCEDGETRMYLFCNDCFADDELVYGDAEEDA